MTKILNKRGLKENLPSLDTGELGFCTDTEELYIGNEEENVLIASKESAEITHLSNPNLLVDGGFEQFNRKDFSKIISTETYFSGFFTMMSDAGVEVRSPTYGEGIPQLGVEIARRNREYDQEYSANCRVYYKYQQHYHGVPSDIFDYSNRKKPVTLTVELNITEPGVFWSIGPEQSRIEVENVGYNKRSITSDNFSPLFNKTAIVDLWMPPAYTGLITLLSVKLEQGTESTPLINDYKTDRAIIDNYTTTIFGTSQSMFSTEDKIFFPINFQGPPRTIPLERNDWQTTIKGSRVQLEYLYNSKSETYLYHHSYGAALSLSYGDNPPGYYVVVYYIPDPSIPGGEISPNLKNFEGSIGFNGYIDFRER